MRDGANKLWGLIPAALVGALAGGALEAARAGSAVGLGVFAWVAPALVVLGLVLLPLGRTRAWRRLGADPAGLVAGGVLAALVASGLGVYARLVVEILRETLRDMDLLAPALGGGVVVTALGLGLLAWFLFDPLRWVLRRVPLAVSVVVGAAVAGGALWVGLGVPLRALAKDMSPWPGLGLALAVVVGAAVWLWTRRRGWLLAAGAAAALVGLGVWGGVSYSADAQARARLADARGLTPLLVRLAQKATDGDGDGHSDWLAGGDCDDADPTVGPMAVDLPGNGVDEDCDGVDRAPSADDPPATVKHHPRPLWMSQDWNFLIVTIDAVRADHLPIHGYHRNTAPNMTALAQNGLVFERAYTPANATRFAIPAMFSGRAIADLEVERVGRYLVTGGTPGDRLFERLRAAGWHTEAHLAEQLKDGMWLGMGRGFDRYEGYADAKLKGASAPALQRAVTQAIGRLGGGPRWALWTHLLEPHEPYHRHKKHDFGDEVVDRYDSEIKAADEALGVMLDALERTGQRENTVVIVSSDHGEEFNEHGRRFHGKQLYEESVRVPLIIHIPGAPARRVGAPVNLTDVAETVANIAGAEPGRDFGARSHVDLLSDGEPDWERAVFIECIEDIEHPKRRKVALIHWPWKLIIDLRRRHEHLFNLEADPKERKNLTAAEPAVLERLKGALMAEVSRQENVLFARMLGARVSDEAPRFLEAAPVEVAPGLEWLGSRLGKRTVGEKKVHEVRNWFRASGPERPDLRIRIDVIDHEGVRRRRRDYRPLAGLYPTHRWQVGEVVEDRALLRFPRKFGSTRIEMSLLRGREVVFGPQVVGEIQITAGG